MKKGLFIALLLMLCTVIKAQEPTVETVGNLKYYCDPATMEATVVGPIESWDNDEFNQSFTKIDIQTTVTSGGNMYKVTTIGEEAFYSFDYVKEVNIPEGIETIEKIAFLSMYRLEKVVLPSTLKKIGYEAFSYERALTSVISHVTDPSAVEVDKTAFALQLDDWDDELGEYKSLKPYQAELYVPEGTKENYVGTYWDYFSKIIEGEPVMKVVGSLKYQYFKDSKSAKVVAGDYAAMTSVEIPVTVTIDGTDYAVTSIENLSFDGCDKLTSVTLHEGLHHIGSFAFRDCVNLEEINFPSSLAEIRTGAFWGCEKFKNVSLVEGLTYLGTFVFYNCSNLETVELPSTLTCMEYGTFLDLSKLKSVISFVQEPFEIEDGVFGSWGEGDPIPFIPSNATLYIPEGTAEKYYAKNWSKQLTLVTIFEKQEVTLSFPKTEYTFDLDDDTFTAPELNNPQGVTVKYSSDHPETISVNETSGDVTILQAGTATITATFDGNYKYKPASASYKLTAAATPITVTADDVEIEYGDKVPTLTYTVTGGTLNGTPVVSCEATAQSSAGTYTITIEKGSVKNKNVTYKNGTLTIKKAPLTIKAGTYSKNQGEANPVFTLTYEGFRNGETKDVLTTLPNVQCTANSDSPAGEYPVTVSGAEAQNYDISYVNGKLTIIGSGGPDDPTPAEETITISGALQVPYYSAYNLDFTDKPELRAYVATGYDKSTGVIWLTRVKQVPAETGFLLMGDPGDYDIPTIDGVSEVYYKNMFKGTLEGTTLYTTDGDYTNYYLSKGDAGVGFYKVTKEDGVKVGANRCYLPILTDISANGSEGDVEMIKVTAAKQVPYYTSKNLDFSSLDAQGVKAYTATGYNYDTGVIWLTRVKKVPAQTGILVMADVEGDYNVPTATVQSVYENMFVGSETAQTIYTNEEIGGVDYVNYYLSKGDAGVGFYKVTNPDGVKMGANRCYLPIPKRDAASGARGKNGESAFCKMVLSDEGNDDVIAIPLFTDGTTGIDIQSSIFNLQSNEVYYNLQGQPVETPRKGLYIRNGKKVIIR